MNAQETADKTKEALTYKGYCYWKCSELNGEIIAVVKNKGFRPRGFEGVVYTERELIEMCESESFRVIHEAKKLGMEITEDLE